MINEAAKNERLQDFTNSVLRGADYMGLGLVAAAAIGFAAYTSTHSLPTEAPINHTVETRHNQPLEAPYAAESTRNYNAQGRT